MKTRLKQLREQRNAKSAELAKLMNETDSTEGKSGRKWDKEKDQPVYDALMAEIADVDADIERTTKASEVTDTAPPTIKQNERDERNDARKDITAKNFDRFLRNGWGGFNMDEISELRNAMSTTTDAEGGYTVQSEVSSDLIERLKAFGGMRTVAQLLNTSKGNPINWPTTDGTSEVGEIVAQNTQAGSQDITFGTVAIGAYKYSSKIVTVPFELMQDSEVDVEALVNRRLVERIARIENQHFTVGTGTAQPEGIIPGIGVGVAASNGSSQVTATSYDSLVDLMHSVDPAYRASAKWMMHDSSLQGLYKLVDGEGRPLFWAASRDLSDSMPMTLLGRGITINQDMPEMAASAKSIVFGDMSKYIIRDVMAVSLFRFADSKYIEKGQIGFLAWFRADGKFTDNGDSCKVFQNAAS